LVVPGLSSTKLTFQGLENLGKIQVFPGFVGTLIIVTAVTLVTATFGRTEKV